MVESKDTDPYGVFFVCDKDQKDLDMSNQVCKGLDVQEYDDEEAYGEEAHGDEEYDEEDGTFNIKPSPGLFLRKKDVQKEMEFVENKSEKEKIYNFDSFQASHMEMNDSTEN